MTIHLEATIPATPEQLYELLTDWRVLARLDAHVGHSHAGLRQLYEAGRHHRDPVRVTVRQSLPRRVLWSVPAGMAPELCDARLVVTGFRDLR
jgi:hypothetical protein